METAPQSDSLTVTELLCAAQTGDAAAANVLADRVYGELRRIARRHFRSERSGHTLQPTVLANEAFMRLINSKEIDWKDRGQFFGYASRLMRQFLIQHARSRKARGERVTLTLDGVCILSSEDPTIFITIDEALNRLERMDAVLTRIVEMRCYAGMSVEETAEALQMAPRTVKRKWRVARLWLHSQIGMQLE